MPFKSTQMRLSCFASPRQCMLRTHLVPFLNHFIVSLFVSTAMTSHQNLSYLIPSNRISSFANSNIRYLQVLCCTGICTRTEGRWWAHSLCATPSPQLWVATCLDPTTGSLRSSRLFSPHAVKSVSYVMYFWSFSWYFFHRKIRWQSI